MALTHGVHTHRFCSSPQHWMPIIQWLCSPIVWFPQRTPLSGFIFLSFLKMPCRTWVKQGQFLSRTERRGYWLVWPDEVFPLGYHSFCTWHLKDNISLISTRQPRRNSTHLCMQPLKRCSTWSWTELRRRTDHYMSTSEQQHTPCIIQGLFLVVRGKLFCGNK